MASAQDLLRQSGFDSAQSPSNWLSPVGRRMEGVFVSATYVSRHRLAS